MLLETLSHDPWKILSSSISELAGTRIIQLFYLAFPFQINQQIETSRDSARTNLSFFRGIGRLRLSETFF